MEIHCARLICVPSPQNLTHGRIHEAVVTFYAYCDSEEAFSEKILDLLEKDHWTLIRIETPGVTSVDALRGKAEVLESLAEQGDFAMVHARHGSDN